MHRQYHIRLFVNNGVYNNKNKAANTTKFRSSAQERAKFYRSEFQLGYIDILSTMESKIVNMDAKLRLWFKNDPNKN